MKKLIFTLGVVLAVLFMFQESAFAQKKKDKDKGKGGDKEKKKEDKEKIKKLKKEMKDLDPLKFRDMYEEYQILKGEVPTLKRQVDNLSNELSSTKSKVAAKDDEIARAKQECEQKKQTAEANRQAAELAAKEKEKSNSGEDFSKGTVLKVQIGKIGGWEGPAEGTQDSEMDKDGAIKYTLGYFKIGNPNDKAEYDRVFGEAQKLQNYLKKMGVKHASVIKYIDGVRQ